MNPAQNNNPNRPMANEDFPIPAQHEEIPSPQVDDAERREINSDPTAQERKTTGGSTAQQPVQLPTVDTSAIQAVVNDSGNDDSSTPLVADDVDVIEKEWVDRAKAVIQAYENDPHLQEREINKLQQSYLEKRYNKKISKLDN